MDSVDKDFFVKCFLKDLEIEMRTHLPNEGNYGYMLQKALFIMDAFIRNQQAKGW